MNNNIEYTFNGKTYKTLKSFKAVRTRLRKKQIKELNQLEQTKETKKNIKNLENEIKKELKDALDRKKQIQKEKRITKKNKEKVEKINNSIKINEEYWTKIQNIKNSKKSSIITKFFENNKRPINMFKNVKYVVNDGGREIKTFEKQFVDVYNIYFSPFITKYDLILRDKLLTFLGLLYRKFKNGVFQIDLMGVWNEKDLNEDNTEVLDGEQIKKVSIRAFELTPLNYKKLMDEILKSTASNSSDNFLIKEIDIKFIKPIIGGCYSCEGRGKNFKIDKLTLHNPYSTNNNCFFKIIEKFLKTKPTKTRCNEIRKEFGIKENEMISFQNAYKIGKKYTDKTISFITNNIDIMYGDEDAEIKIFCLDNHFMEVIGENKKCNKCGTLYINNHICNNNCINFYNNKIKKLIEKRETIDKGLLNYEILHYDIETHYNNPNKQHMPYIVGFCYYDVNKNLVYDIFFGDDCMNIFYNFLGSNDIKHVKFINAFNGSGFDHYYLMREKIKSKEKVGKFILNNGNLLTATIQNKKLIDLSKHISGSLENNLKQYKCKISKGSLNHNISKRWEETEEERKKEVKEYLKCDVMGLCELYEKINEPMYSKFKINLCEKITTSANAYDIWRDKYLNDKIFLLDDEKETYIRQAIYGGRCYKNKNRFTSNQYEDIINNKINFDDINDYIFVGDVVSLYASAMADYKYPIGKEKITNIYHNDKLGIYKIEYKAPKNLLNPVLPRKEDKKLIWDLQDSCGWYSSVDIENAKLKGYKIKIITGYYWEESGFIFKEYMNDFFEMKKNSIKGTPAYLTSKSYLTSLYGKMLQKTNHSKNIIIKSAEEFWTLLNKNIIQEMTNIDKTWLVKYTPKPEFIKDSGAEKPSQLGVFILAYSRRIMNNYYDKCENTIEKLPYYYDTDSLYIHSSCLNNIKINKEMGGLDDDIGGKVIRAIYISPKMYALKYIISEKELNKRLIEKPNLKFDKLNNDCYMLYHFRGKGVSNNVLTWKDFEDMDKGIEKDFYREFQIKKINMKKTSKEQNYDHFSHKHILKENTKKTINKNIWAGRLFIDDNNSVPFGYDLTLLKNQLF